MVRHRVPSLRAATLALLLALPATVAGSEANSDPTTPLRRALAEADAALHAGEPEIAESRLRSALLEGWLLLGAAHVAAGELPAAREALVRASTVSVEIRRPNTSLAVVLIQLGEAEQAVATLRQLPAQVQRELGTRRLLAQAMVAAGHPEQALAELEDAYAAAPGDIVLAYTLASGHLRLGHSEAAGRLFAEVLELRPGAATHVLIGRTYRDFGAHVRAREELNAALALDPKVRRAHYYLGTLSLLDPDGPQLEAAIAELRQELALFPHDQPSLLYLGMALVEAQRYEEALAPLVEVSRGEQADAEGLYYLGRCQLGLGRAQEAVETLRRALALAPAEGVDARRVQGIEYQLALALRRQGNEAEATVHFAEAERLSSALSARSQERLTRFLSDEAEPPEIPQVALSAFSDTPLDAVPPAQRESLRLEVEKTLARTYLDLAVMRMRTGEFARAVALLGPAAELDPAQPGLDRALGIAHFNARSFGAAIEALGRALEKEPADAELRRLLALAHLETGNFAEAAQMLAGDEQRAVEPSLQYAYALALVRSGRAADAKVVFDELLRDHGRWPELHVLLGQAYASQSDFDAAIAALQRALELSPSVPEAQATLGTIFMRQGRLEEAEGALRAELRNHPDDRQARYQLATVLDLAGRQNEAIVELSRVLEAMPGFADGRYLLGKMLLARGDARGAAAELETAAKLAPRDANVQYQLGQAYQKLGQSELASRAFEAYRELKRAEREGGR